MAKNVQKGPRFGALDNLTVNQEHTPTSTPTHTPTPTPVLKERKTKRLQLLLKESTVTALGEYAERNGTSRNDIVQQLLDDFLNKNV